MDKHFDFLFKNSTNVHVVEDSNGTLWFAARDVAKALGFDRAHEMLRYVKWFERREGKCMTAGGIQTIVYLSEPGVYAAIFGGKTSKAAEFREWVVTKVLPAIRKFGMYVDDQTGAALRANPNIINDLMDQLEEFKRQGKRHQMYHLVDPKGYGQQNIDKMQKEFDSKLNNMRAQLNNAESDLFRQSKSFDEARDQYEDAFNTARFVIENPARASYLMKLGENLEAADGNMTINDVRDGAWGLM